MLVDICIDIQALRSLTFNATRRVKYAHQVAFPKGDLQNPLNWEEVAAKFRDCAFPLSDEQIGRVQDAVRNLESLETMVPLMDLLTTVTP